MTVPDRIDPREQLGRRVFSEGDARRARRRARALHRVFLEWGKTEVSVDRLSVSGLSAVAVVAEAASTSRDGPFRGWAFVVSEEAAVNGRQVRPSPRSENPFHADIVLPAVVVHNRDEHRRHALELADASRWCEPELQQQIERPEIG